MKEQALTMNTSQSIRLAGFGLLALAALGFANPSHAASISLGQPGYGGSGCPAGSASVSVSPDGSSLSILFDSYTVEAGGSNPQVARKSCNLSIPVKVPNGMSVSLISADYRGFADLPAGAEARLDTEYFFGGSRGPAYSQRFNGRFSNTYLKRHQMAAGANVWSACGADVNLRVNSGMTVRSSGEAALATVDSADFNAGILYHLQYRSCNSNSTPHNNRPPASNPAQPPPRNNNVLPGHPHYQPDPRRPERWDRRWEPRRPPVDLRWARPGHP